MVNQIILIGRLGSDPELKYLPSGTSVTNFSFATSEKYKKEGEMQEVTTWHRIAAYGRLADVCSSYLKKGSLTFIQGKLRNNSWEDTDGNKHSDLRVVVEKIAFLDPKKVHERSPDESTPEDDVPF
ncbi:MAG: single-stranded DNA-binding protein [Syntrophaceae bacterium]